MALKNKPEIWCDVIGRKTGDKHKYDYGYVAVFAGPRMTGAASLAALSALRMGTGAVAIIADPKISDVFRHFSPSFIVNELEETAQFIEHIKDEKRNTVLIGPGAGQKNPAGLKKAVLDSLHLKKITVIDADALTVFKDDPDQLFKELNPKSVLTPHGGEFERLFPDLEGANAEKAVRAAKRSGSIIVLKGQETLIATPDGKLVSSDNGTGWLATAGSGDVLAGMIAGLCAWHEDAIFEAVCAAVWMHGETSNLAGPGLISEDLPNKIPEVWASLLN